MPTISSEKTYVFESMPVRQAVLKQAMPAVASQMVVLIYNLADTYFVGMLDDPVQTAAVTVAFPAFLMLTAISNLFGVGGASRLAQALGRKRERSGRPDLRRLLLGRSVLRPAVLPVVRPAGPAHPHPVRGQGRHL